ncbi:TPA: hypothetical protein RUX58_001249 [Aeromonas dhakensis]|nr:hypothetical protein [Aeromonas dhakensis]
MLISCLDEVTVSAVIIIKEKKYHGTLSYGGGKQIIFNMHDDWWTLRDLLKQGEKIDVLECELNGDSVFLCQCEVDFGSVFAEFLSTKEITLSSEISILDIYIDGLSVAMDNSSRENEIDEKQFVITRPRSNFLVSLEHITVSDDWISSLKRNSESTRAYLAVDSHFIRLSFDNNPISIEGAKNYLMQLLGFFSILLMHPLNISRLKANLVGKDSYAEIYIPFSVHNNSFKNESCLLDLKSLSNEQWELAFKNLFIMNFNSSIWSRFRGMLMYEGYWEYNILGVVSLLDSYLEEKYGVRNKKSKLIGKLNAALFNLKSVLSSELQEEFDKEQGNIRIVMNQPSFKVRYMKMVDELSDGFIKWCGLNEQQFSKIKKVRDSVAHSDVDEINNTKDHLVNFTIKNRILILLSYLFFKELGFNETEYYKLIRGTVNKVARSAFLDDYYLRKAIGDCFEIKCTNSASDEFSKVRRVSSPIFVFHGGVWSFDEEASSRIFEITFESKCKSIAEAAEIFYSEKGIEVSSSEYKGTVYLVDDNSHHVTNNATLVYIQ